MLRRRIVLNLSLLACTLAPWAVGAQDGFPGKPVRIIVPQTQIGRAHV